MTQRSIYDFDVSVSADKARRARRRGHSGEFESSTRRCEHPECDRAAGYRAPKSPTLLDEYRWFCLDHVREYNKSWNYFEDWSEDAIDRQMRNDAVWDRPTWSFKDAPKEAYGQHPHSEGRAWARFGFDDAMDVLGENATINPGRQGREQEDPARSRMRRLPPNERRALQVLSQPADATRSVLKKAFRAQVKALHPDNNGGSREDEQRLQETLWAWEQLKDSRNFKD